MSSLQRELTVSNEPRVPNARAFIRSLNILLKYARLYGLDHARSAGQFESAWTELQDAVDAAGQGGLLLGASGSQLLLDGVPLESTPAERSFADLLTNAGVASICFSPHVIREDFLSFVRSFMESGIKSAGLAERLEANLGRNSGIRLNEIRFVAEDAGFSEARVAAQLTAKTLGADAERVQEWFSSPEKMIQLIAAAEGSHGGAGGEGTGDKGIGLGGGTGIASAQGSGPIGGGSGGGGGFGPGSAVGGASGISQLEERDLQSLLRLLAQFGEAQQSKDLRSNPMVWQERLAGLPQNA